MDFVEAELQELAEGLITERGLCGCLGFREGVIDSVVVHVLHDPVGGGLEVVLGLEQSPFGCVLGEAHVDQLVHVLCGIF